MELALRVVVVISSSRLPTSWRSRGRPSSLEGCVVSKLLEPDFWVAVWSKLLEPDFWVTLWSTFLGFDFWGTVWKAFSDPEVVIPLVPLLLIATYVGWKIKGGFDTGKIKGMKTQIDAAEQRAASGWGRC